MPLNPRPNPSENAHQGCFLIRDVGAVYLTQSLDLHLLLRCIHLCKLYHIPKDFIHLLDAMLLDPFALCAI